MNKLGVLLVVLIGAVGCAQQPVSQKVSNVSNDMMPATVRSSLYVDDQLSSVCLKREAHYYCGESKAVKLAEPSTKAAETPSRFTIENWQVGSIYIDNDVIFVVVDEDKGSVWTLPVNMNKTVLELAADKTDDAPGVIAEAQEERAGYHCHCPDFRKAFSAAAMTSTF